MIRIPQSAIRSPQSPALSPPLYLASQSPRRRALLRQMGLKFRVLRPNIVEALSARKAGTRSGIRPRQFAVRVAERKVRAVEHRVRRGIIIGADTIVVLDCEIMGKPRDRQDARRMLEALSGQTHQVIGGLCLLRKPGRKLLRTTEVTSVRFRRLDRKEIEAYLRTREPYDKAGAYGIQGRAGRFVAWIQGDYWNVVGLPVARLTRMLAQLVLEWQARPACEAEKS